jgi:hypothetical protein
LSAEQTSLEAQQYSPQQEWSDGQHPPSAQHLSVDDEQHPLKGQHMLPDGQQPSSASVQHTLPLAQQLLPPQHTRPGAQHWLPQHELPTPQHWPPQHTLPDGQQLPLQQVAPDGQALSQLPQLLVSVLVSTHVPRQLVRPTGHGVHCPADTVQPWFWNCAHDTQSLSDSDDAEMSRHWKPLHHTCAVYGNVVVGTPTLRVGNCCWIQDVASDWVNATGCRVVTRHDEPSSTNTVIGTGVTQLPLLQRLSPEQD